MAEGKLTVGNVDVLALTDGEGDFPFPLSQLFPSVPAEAWTPFVNATQSFLAVPTPGAIITAVTFCVRRGALSW